jgi:hypothetical protein
MCPIISTLSAWHAAGLRIYEVRSVLLRTVAETTGFRPVACV